MKRIGYWQAYSKVQQLAEQKQMCVKLEKLKVPESLKTIGYFAFEDCHEKLAVEEYAKEETGD